MSLAHFTIPTRDVEATAAFFEATVRWKRVPIPHNTPRVAAWLEMDDGRQVHVLEVEDFEVSAFEQEFGRHIALFHADQDMEPLKARLAEAGAELIPPIRPTPFERFFFRDPNGYMFEVIARGAWTRDG